MTDFAKVNIAGSGWYNFSDKDIFKYFSIPLKIVKELKDECARMLYNNYIYGYLIPKSDKVLVKNGIIDKVDFEPNYSSKRKVLRCFKLSAEELRSIEGLVDLAHEVRNKVKAEKVLGKS